MCFISFTLAPVQDHDTNLMSAHLYRKQANISEGERTGKLHLLLHKAAAYSNFLSGSMPVKPVDVVEDEEVAEEEAEAESPDSKKRKKGTKVMTYNTYMYIH